MSRSVFEMLVEHVRGVNPAASKDYLAAEEPLEIQLGYGPADSRAVKSISVTMRTPGHDYELAAGFLFTEGVVRDAFDIESVSYVTGGQRAAFPRSGANGSILPELPGRNTVKVELAPGVSVALATLERNFYTTSSCGVCGKASLLALQTVCPPRVHNTFSINAEVLYRLPGQMRGAQDVFDRTGGLHGAGLFDSEGTLLRLHKDVGRHNAVDKLVGAEFLADRTPLRNRLLLLSGRASFELLEKAVMGGISMVASVGAPSSLAVQVAQHFDIALIGFLRDDHFNIYHGTRHIAGLRRASEEEACEAAD